MDQKNNDISSDLIIGRKRFWKVAGILLAGLVLGILISGAYFQFKLKKAKSECDQQLVKAKEQSLSGGIPKVCASNELFGISGTIEKIDGNTLTVEAFFFGGKKTYKVTVNSDTKIVRREMLQNLPEPEEGKPFNPIRDTEGKLSDLKEKDNIVIEADSNIKDKTEFEAKTIYLMVNFTGVP
ncbi:MAG: hypothetical protein V1814_02350 [Candidatus Moraniibacteriota bacterium]